MSHCSLALQCTHRKVPDDPRSVKGCGTRSPCQLSDNVQGGCEGIVCFFAQLGDVSGKSHCNSPSDESGLRPRHRVMWSKLWTKVKLWMLIRVVRSWTPGSHKEIHIGQVAEKPAAHEKWTHGDGPNESQRSLQNKQRLSWRKEPQFDALLTPRVVHPNEKTEGITTVSPGTDLTNSGY